MKSVLAAVTAVCLLAAGGEARAWGAKGHQLVGGLAAEQLNPRAKSALTQILAGFGTTSTATGPDLATAAVWADCVRDVYAKAGGGLAYRIDPQFTPNACRTLAATDEPARMIDYASRNWTQCVYSPGCHGAYHFTDVTLQRGGYDPAGHHAGTSDHDVVHAIQAALAVLQGKPCPAPFDIRGQREAVLLLAHLVGDLHQPLHVGAVYLDDQGAIIDPDATPGDDHEAETRGGNSLKFGTDKNLHSAWDDVGSLSVTPALLASSKRTTPTAGSVDQWPVVWASASVLRARDAYANVTYSAVTQTSSHKRYWVAQFADQNAYGASRRKIQSPQVALAGARLAALYNSVWP